MEYAVNRVRGESFPDMSTSFPQQLSGTCLARPPGRAIPCYPLVPFVAFHGAEHANEMLTCVVVPIEERAFQITTMLLRINREYVAFHELSNYPSVFLG